MTANNNMKETIYTGTRQGQTMIIAKKEYNRNTDYWEIIFKRCQKCEYNDKNETIPAMNCKHPGEIRIKNSKCTMFKK